MRGGLRYVQFRDGTRLDYNQPLNTMDPRYDNCTEHRTACICREAEWSEEVNEYRGEYHGFRGVVAQVLRGHHGDVCRCTGCEIARRLGLSFLAAGDGEEGAF